MPPPTQFHSLLCRSCSRKAPYLPSSIWCLDAWIQEKISHWCCYWPLVVLFFCFLFFVCFCCCSQSGWLWFSSAAFSPTVLPFIKTEPHIMTAFSNGIHRSQMSRVDADCIRKEHAEIPALCSVCHWNKSGTLISWVNQIHSSNVGELFIEF